MNLNNILIENNPILNIISTTIGKSQKLSSLAQYLRNLFLNSVTPNSQKFLFTLGAVSVTFWAIRFAYKIYTNTLWVPMHFIHTNQLSAQKLKERYGECWVLITGSTDGIGLGFAKQFAQYGFKLVMVARNAQKLQKVIDQIQREVNRECIIKTIIADLGMEQDLQKLQIQLQQMGEDIGIVINNAGVGGPLPFLQRDHKELAIHTRVNYHSAIIINRVLLPKLRLRKCRSAILNIGSCTGHFLSPMLGVYSSNKKMLDIYSQTLEIQNRDKIDVLTVRPFGVTTKMMRMRKGPMMITVEDCVKSTLADLLAKHKITYTGFKHKFMAVCFNSINQKNRYIFYQKTWQQFL